MPSLEPVGPDFAQRTRHIVTTTVDVDVSSADVWAALVDTDSWTIWFPGMKRCETTSEPAGGLGSTRRVRVGLLVADEEFVAWEPGRTWAFTVTRTNLPIARQMLERIDLMEHGTPNDPRTRIEYTGAFTPHVLSLLTFPLVKREIRRAWTTGLMQLGPHVHGRNA